MTNDEIQALFTPRVLTTSARNIEEEINRNDPLLLTGKLGRNVESQATNTITFEIEEATYNLAPLSYVGDPAVNVNIGRNRTPYTVTPPQIFLKDMLTASEMEHVRMAGQNPINMTSSDKGSAYNQLIAVKQQGLSRLINRRIEWLFAQTMRGKIDFTSEQGRQFTFDFKLPNAVNIGTDYWNTSANADPIKHLRALAKQFMSINNQLAPDFIVMGSAAADAFINNSEVKEWMRSQGQQIYQSSVVLAGGNAQVIGNLYGADLYEYSARYQDSKGKEQSYLDDNYVYMTNSSLWRLFYGAIYDYDAGNPPIVVGSRFSKMKSTEDGKAMNIYIESHPLPIVFSNSAVLKAKVIN